MEDDTKRVPMATKKFFRVIHVVTSGKSLLPLLEASSDMKEKGRKLLALQCDDDIREVRFAATHFVFLPPNGNLQP